MQSLATIPDMLRGLLQPPPTVARTDVLAPPEPDVVKLVNDRYAYARDAKQCMVETWATCLAFYVGEQWRRWEPMQQRLVRPARLQQGRIHAIYNQMPGIVDAIATKLSATSLPPRAVPDDPDDPVDRERANTATQAIRGWYAKRGLEVTEHRVNVARTILGAAFLHLVWDPREIGKIAVPDMMGGVSYTAAPVGDLKAELLSVFDVFPEPVECWEDVGWMIIARRKPVRWFEETFGERGSGVRPDRGETESVFTSLIPGAESANPTSGARSGDGLATLKIYYERPCPKYPQGRTAMATGDRLMWAADKLPLPYAGARTPFPVKMVEFRFVLGRMWPKGLVEECLSPQREMNRGLSKIQEWLQKHSGPKWFVAKEARVDPKAITAMPDEVVVYSNHLGGGKPEMAPPAAMPSWVADHPNVFREELRHVAGLHEVSEGMVPSGVSAASAIRLLQGAENSRHSSPALLGRAGLADFWQHVLVVLDERYREERVLPTLGRNPGIARVMGGFGPLEVLVEPKPIEEDDTVRQEQLKVWVESELWTLLGTPMIPVVLSLMRETGQGWMADAIERMLPQMQALQQQQMLEQAALAGAGMGEGGAESPRT